MTRLLLPLILLAVAVALFFTFTDKLLAQIDELKAEKLTLDEGIDRALELEGRQKELIDKFNALDEDVVGDLDKLLPDNIDNVRLIIDINNIAKTYGQTIKSVSITNADAKEGETATGENLIKSDSVILNFSFSASYEVMKQFLQDLANSLRLVDVVSLAFTSSDQNLYNFSIGLKTYWLK